MTKSTPLAERIGPPRACAWGSDSHAAGTVTDPSCGCRVPCGLAARHFTPGRDVVRRERTNAKPLQERGEVGRRVAKSGMARYTIARGPRRAFSIRQGD